MPAELPNQENFSHLLFLRRWLADSDTLRIIESVKMNKSCLSCKNSVHFSSHREDKSAFVEENETKLVDISILKRFVKLVIFKTIFISRSLTNYHWRVSCYIFINYEASNRLGLVITYRLDLLFCWEPMKYIKSSF